MYHWKKIGNKSKRQNGIDQIPIYTILMFDQNTPTNHWQ